MKNAIAEDIYNRSLTINKEAFQAGMYDSAYHALMSALHSAELLESNEPLLHISQVAKEQLAWIDEHHPEYEHSTASTTRRNLGRSIFALTASQADTIVKMRKAMKWDM